MSSVKAGKAASTSLKFDGKPAILYRSLSSKLIVRVNAFPNTSASISRPGVALQFRRHDSVLRLKYAYLHPQCRQASSDVSTSDGGLNRTALYDLHVRNGGQMVPFGGYSMPVQYSDLGVGESHKWTREKASLFDVGHMYAALLSPAAPSFRLTLTFHTTGYNIVYPAQALHPYLRRLLPRPQPPSRPISPPFPAFYIQLLEV